MKFPIKIVFDFDYNEYVCFIDGIKGIEGRGITEAEAIEDFKVQQEKLLKQNS